MSNLTNMGLPQGLPDIPNYRPGYSPTCYCMTCQQVRSFSNIAQDYVQGTRAENSESCAREMTAADLGLIQCSERNYVIVCPPVEMTAADLGLPERRLPATWPRDTNGHLFGSDDWLAADAPYSFWLGAHG